MVLHNSAPNLDQHLSDVLSTRFISLQRVVPSINTENSHNMVVSELMRIIHILLLWMSYHVYGKVLYQWLRCYDRITTSNIQLSTD